MTSHLLWLATVYSYDSGLMMLKAPRPLVPGHWSLGGQSVVSVWSVLARCEVRHSLTRSPLV